MEGIQKLGIDNFKEIIASSHINFLFGAGVNGCAFPQLNNFRETISFMEEMGASNEGTFEEKLNSLDLINRETAAKKFCEEFNSVEIDYNNNSLINLKKLLKICNDLVSLTENRQKSMKKINIFTLNYDNIVENILDDLGYFKTVATVDNLKTIPLFDVIPFNLEYNTEMSAFVVAKLHGTIKGNNLSPNQIIYPGNKKYETSLAADFFEVMFKMKSELMKFNSTLFIIGYSGFDNHINKVINDCIENGLTVYWYKYNNEDIIPEIFKNRIVEIAQEETKIDTTERCFKMISEVINYDYR